MEGLGGEMEGAKAALTGEVEGAEVVHDLAVSDGDNGVGAVVLRHRSHVRQLWPPARGHPQVGVTARNVL